MTTKPTPDATDAPAQGATPTQGAAGSGAVALPGDVMAEFAEAARNAAAKERPSVARISLKGGALTYMGNTLPTKTIELVLIGVGYWRRYYEGAYNPNQTVNPTCFAISEDSDDGMTPHENVEHPQHDNCDACPLSQWKSDPRGGKGKACKDGRRLAAIPADALASAEAFGKAEIAVLDIPPTSLANYANYINSLAASVARPMWAVVTRLEVVPDPKTQFKVTFTPVRTIDNFEVIQAIKARLGEGVIACTVPYDEAYLQGETRDQNVKSPASGKTAKFRA